MMTLLSAFRQQLKSPLALSQNCQVALFNMYCMRSFGNELLKSCNDYHCQVGHTNEYVPPDILWQSVQLPRHQQLTHIEHLLEDLIQENWFVHLFPFYLEEPIITGKCTWNLQAHLIKTFPPIPKWIIFAAIWWMPGWPPTRHSLKVFHVPWLWPPSKLKCMATTANAPTSCRFSTLSCPDPSPESLPSTLMKQ